MAEDLVTLVIRFFYGQTVQSSPMVIGQYVIDIRVSTRAGRWSGRRDAESSAPYMRTRSFAWRGYGRCRQRQHDPNGVSMSTAPASPPPLLRPVDPRLGEAIAYAAIVHADQARKGTDAPYLCHLLQVAGLVIEHGRAPETAVAAEAGPSGQRHRRGSASRPASPRDAAAVPVCRPGGHFPPGPP